MPISFVDSESSTSNNPNVTVPAHAAGDLILVLASNDSNTAPIPNASYVTLKTFTHSALSCTLAYRIATGTSDGSGAWANTEGWAVGVYRAPEGMFPYATDGSTGDISPASFPSPTLQNDGGTSWVAAFLGAAGSPSIASFSGAVEREKSSGPSGGAKANFWDSNGGVTSWGAKSISLSSTRWIAFTVEIAVIGVPMEGSAETSWGTYAEVHALYPMEGASNSQFITSGGLVPAWDMEAAASFSFSLSGEILKEAAISGVLGTSFSVFASAEAAHPLEGEARISFEATASMDPWNFWVKQVIPNWSH